MKLLVIRHAVAERRSRFARSGEPDSKRPLTPEGRKKMKAAAKGIKKICPAIHAFGSSPYLRAAQTATIVLGAYHRKKFDPIPSLIPGGSPNDFLAWLRSHKKRDTVSIFGHEPSLSRLAGWLISGKPKSFVKLKKGSALMLEFPRAPRAGGAKLLWMLKPSQLRKLGKG